MGWELSGQMVESCSCNMLCPCWFGVKELMIMDKGYCAGPILFRIEKGNSNDVDLRGRNVVLGFDFPGPTVLDGNATTRLFIDDEASQLQHRELEQIFQGKKGGPMQVISSLSSRWLPTISAKIDIRNDGQTLTASVGNVGKIKSTQIKNESGHLMTVHGTGFAAAFKMENETFALAPSASEWSDHDMPHASITTKSGVAAKFRWKGN